MAIEKSLATMPLGERRRLVYRSNGNVVLTDRSAEKSEAWLSSPVLATTAADCWTLGEALLEMAKEIERIMAKNDKNE